MLPGQTLCQAACGASHPHCPPEVQTGKQARPLRAWQAPAQAAASQSACAWCPPVFLPGSLAYLQSVPCLVPPALQVKPGDVLVVQNRGVGRAAAQFWPAGSQQAQAYNAADAVLPEAKGGRRPGLPSHVAAAGAGATPTSAAARSGKRKRRAGQGDGIAAAASDPPARNAALATASVPASGTASGHRGARRCNWRLETAADGTACISVVLSEAVAVRQTSQAIPGEAECTSPAMRAFDQPLLSPGQVLRVYG